MLCGLGQDNFGFETSQGHPGYKTFLHILLGEFEQHSIIGYKILIKKSLGKCLCIINNIPECPCTIGRPKHHCYLFLIGEVCFIEACQGVSEGF